MKAAVLISPGVLELVDLPDPEPPKGGALVKVRACAVCGTDVKMLKLGHRDLAYPRVLGHEIVGEVAEIDRDCEIAEKDLVQVWPGIACGQCRPCRRGEDSRCQEMKILGFNRDGGFAEMLALPPECILTGLNVLPGGSDPVRFSLAEPLACCINGQDQVKVRSGDVVLILGAGPIGCLHALVAELMGAEKIIVIEKLQNRIQEIERHTMATVMDASEPLPSLLAEETGSAGVDVILIATPEVRVDNALVKLLAPGGRICVFSGPKTGNCEAPLDLRSLHYRELKIAGAYGCSSHQNRKAVELLASEEIKADWIVTKRATLANIQDALRHSSQRSGLKSVICGK